MGLVIARERPRWPIGCFNRPWTNWSLDEALAAMKSAGYEQIGLLTPTRDDPFIGPAATTEYLANLQEKINAHGLRAIMGALASRHDIPLAVDSRCAASDRQRPPSFTPVRSVIWGRQSRRVRPLLPGHGECGFLRGRARHRARDEASWRRQRRIGRNPSLHREGEAPQLQNLVRRRKHHLLHRQRSADGTGACRPIRYWVLREGLCRTKRKCDDPVWRRQGGLRRDFSEAEIRRLRRTNNG